MVEKAAYVDPPVLPPRGSAITSKGHILANFRAITSKYPEEIQQKPPKIGRVFGNLLYGGNGVAITMAL